MRCLLLLLLPSLAAAQVSLTPFTERKAVTILRQQTSCLGCHELNGDGGRLGPSLSDVGTRRSAAYIRAMIDDPQRLVPGSMMPKPRLDPATRSLISAYLTRNAPAGTLTLPPLPVPGSRFPDPASLYGRWCSGCHGPSGAGDGPNARYLPVKPAAHRDAAAMGARPDDSLYDAIAAGGAIMGRSPRMPAFAGTLTPAEIRALVGYIRTLCSCAAPAWSRDPGASP
jgi:mono/diheme cytochrome c family protein